MTLTVLLCILPPDATNCNEAFYTSYILLVIAFVGIVAAGNIHNDICDRTSDWINKKHKVIVGRIMPLTQTKVWLMIFFILGFTSALLLSSLYKNWSFGLYYMLFALWLFVYNKWLKCLSLIGNLSVSIFCSCVVLAPLFLTCSSWGGIGKEVEYYRIYIASFAGFAFLVTLIREIVKDMEDINGDRQVGCNTFVVSNGLQRSRTLVFALSIGLLLSLVVSIYLIKSQQTIYQLLALGIFVLFPFACFIRNFWIEKVALSQRWLKVLMIFGLLSLVNIAFSI